MKEIQSVKNPLIKETKKLNQKKYREQKGAYLLEGFHLIEEAVESGQHLMEVFVSERGMKQWSEWLQEQFADYYVVSEEVLKSLASQPTPQGIVAVVAQPEEKMPAFKGGWLLLDNVQDPGNVGTMIRTADAAGFSCVVLGEGTADLYNPKTLRSTQGSHYHLPVLRADLKDLVPKLQEKMPVYGTALDRQALDYRQVQAQTDVGVIMGNEGQGLNKELQELSSKNLYIPIKGQAESLNVAIAAGILLFRLLK
ncbi:23S rRNA methyltransferase [Enterococcus florum]|uniref:23S rRNA methyltransferase n=1 Tax=Enterococcus florum TaxID=2480627 RepID=A0A4P5P6G8_9ENTE|nr:RNA methyltransferase [Enterococcus florum]GCF93507.1 23S rRNA methyltransferase [Enterococcus florum]